MFAHTCPFYLKVSVASIHIGSTVCALFQGGVDEKKHEMPDMLIHALFYIYNPLLKPLLSGFYSFFSVGRGGVSAIALAYSSLPLLVACCTVLAALLPSVLIVKQADITIPKIIACISYACVCAHVCSWFMSVTGASHPSKFEFQGRAMVCAFQLHAAMHIMYHCMREGNFTSAPVYVFGMVLVHALCIFLPLVAWITMARSPQDILMIHALVAFFPEALGTLFDALLKILRKLLD